MHKYPDRFSTIHDTSTGQWCIVSIVVCVCYDTLCSRHANAAVEQSGHWRRGTLAKASGKHDSFPLSVAAAPSAVHADAVEDALLPADASSACVISLASPATESVDSCSGGGRSGRLGTPPDFVLPTLKVFITSSILQSDICYDACLRH